MKVAFTIFRCELMNCLRNRWLLTYTIFLALSSFGFLYLAEDVNKAELSLGSVLLVVAPLVSILFTTSYWYSNELFTELLLTQPVPRQGLFFARTLALVVSLGIATTLGLTVPFLTYRSFDVGVFWLLFSTMFLSSAFSLLGTLVAVLVMDRMWGLGLALLVWLYTGIMHDALIFIGLLTFRDYPLELYSTIAAALNPPSLVRVILLLHFDAPLLLGYSGALIRHLMESGAGVLWAVVVCCAWLAITPALAYRGFIRRDF